MFWNWFGLRRPKADPQRLLFTYWDGRDVRKKDPFEIEDGLTDALGYDWPEVVAELNVPDPPGLVGEAADQARDQRAEKRRRVLAAICAAFDVRPYTDRAEEDGKPHGLNLIELFGLLAGYEKLAVQLLRASRPFASSQPRASPSTPPASPPPSSPECTSAAAGSPAPAPAS